jgi:Ras GTPase-activating protein 3
MREVFAVLKDLSNHYFPGQREISYSVISGFIFLRFFAPAILNPKLFEITDEIIDPVVGRTLTLMSKTVQMMGNLVSSRIVGVTLNETPPFKEDFMNHLQKSFVTEERIDNIKIVSQFLVLYFSFLTSFFVV